MTNSTNEALPYMYMWHVPESGDFFGELGDSVLFGGEEATAKSKSETIKTNIFSLEKIIGSWNETTVFLFKTCIKIHVTENSLIYRKYQSAVEEAGPPVTFLYCHHPPSFLAIFHKETWNDNKRFCVKLNRKNCIGIYI